MPKQPVRQRNQPPVTRRHHLDRRIKQIQSAPAAMGDDDELLSTAELADWLCVSTQWLEIGRSTGKYGPRFERLGPGMIRYRRGSVRKWLAEREYANTSEYTKPHSRMRKAEA